MTQVAVAARLRLVTVVGNEDIMATTECWSILRVAENGILFSAGRNVKSTRLLLFVDQAKYERVLVGLVLVGRVPFSTRVATEYVARIREHNCECVLNVVATSVEA